jgi:hypothetical protein
MRFGYFLLLLATFSLTSNCLAADSVEWGQPVNGLRMSVSATIEGGTVSQFGVTIQNVGDKDVSVTIGSSSGVSSLAPTIFITSPDGKEWRMSHPDIPLAGRVFPLVVPLVSGASYTVVLAPTSIYGTLDGTHTFAQFMPRIDRVRAELDLSGRWACESPERFAFWVFPCWQGKLISNRLDPWK